MIFALELIDKAACPKRAIHPSLSSSPLLANLNAVFESEQTWD